MKHVLCIVLSLIMTLSVFENVYKKNSKYFNEILDSYSGFAD